jgi:hypothetical protein
MLLTARDRELVEWIGRFGGVEAEQVMGWFGMGRTAAYATATFWSTRWHDCLPPPADADLRAARMSRDLARFDALRDDVAFVRQLEAAKEHRQVIIATHSANLTVLGDAELVIPMYAEAGRVHGRKTREPSTGQALASEFASCSRAAMTPTVGAVSAMGFHVSPAVR